MTGTTVTTRAAREDRRYWIALGCIALLALSVRVGYVAIAKSESCEITVADLRSTYPSECTGLSAAETNDQLYYNALANQLADGNGFTSPFRDGVEWADHPPLTSVVLAAVSFAFERPPFDQLDSATTFANGTVVHTHVREQRYFMALIGTLNVVLIALLTRRIGGNMASLVAAIVAALYPNLWVNDGLLFAETIAITTVVAAMLLALRCWRRGRTVDFVALGAMCALAALTRAELLLLAPLLAIPVAWKHRGAARFAALRRLASAAVATVVVMAPWFVYNQTRFTSTVLNSTNDGLALSGSYCDPVFSGSAIGLWSTEGSCSFDAEHEASLGDQSEVSKAYRTRAFEYARDHLSLLPKLAAVRVARTWGLFRPGQMIEYNRGENRESSVGWAGMITYYVLLLPALCGALALWRCRERVTLWILFVPGISVTLVSAVTYGQTRFRATAEPSIVVLAALGAVWAIDRARDRQHGRRRGEGQPSAVADAASTGAAELA